MQVYIISFILEKKKKKGGGEILHHWDLIFFPHS